jgi:hypothetical protein
VQRNLLIELSFRVLCTRHWRKVDPSDPHVFVETRPKGRPEGSPIEGYVVEDHAEDELAEFETQDEAIRWAKAEGHVPHVARVRHLNDKKKPDQWRAA